MRSLLADMLAEWEELEGKIDEFNRWLVREAKASEACVRLREIPGMDAQTATAFVAAAGDEQGRDVAAWLGLAPREYSTGGKQCLGGISKRGNLYVRKLLVHCARSRLELLSKRTDRLGKWLRRMLETKDRRSAIAFARIPLARASSSPNAEPGSRNGRCAGRS